MDFARELLRLRTKHGLTQRALEAKAGVSNATICRIERGTQDPSLSQVLRLVRALRMRLRIEAP